MIYRVAVAVVAWEALYRLSSYMLRSRCATEHDKLRRQGASYVVALVHAAIMASRGSYHVLRMLSAPTAVKLAIPSAASAWYAVACETETTNVLFLSWLLYDVLHVATAFPALGGVDTVAHHLGFISASLICSTHRILPFPFSWLLCGELSSIPLNVRWFLINSGRGDTAALRMANVAFASTFFASRVVVYGAGLAHLWAVRAELFGALDGLVERPLLLLVLGLLVAGYGLNLVWMRKIVSMALGGAGSGKKRE